MASKILAQVIILVVCMYGGSMRLILTSLVLSLTMTTQTFKLSATLHRVTVTTQSRGSSLLEVGLFVFDATVTKR